MWGRWYLAQGISALSIEQQLEIVLTASYVGTTPQLTPIQCGRFDGSHLVGPYTLSCDPVRHCECSESSFRCSCYLETLVLVLSESQVRVRLTPAPVTSDSRQQRFAARLENACSSKLKELHSNPSSGAPICRVVRKEHEHGRTTEGMNWPAPGEEPAVRTTILDDTAAAKSAVQRWAREKEAKIGAGVWMWWTDGSRSDDGRVGAAAVCKHGNEWRCRRSFLGTGCMEVFDAEL